MQLVSTLHPAIKQEGKGGKIFRVFLENKILKHSKQNVRRRRKLRKRELQICILKPVISGD